MRALALLPWLLVAAAVGSGSLPRPAERAARLLVADGRRSVFPVELGLAIPGTDSVELDGRRLGPEEYDLDLARGLLMLATRPARWSVIRVSCAVLPLPVPAAYRRYEVRPAEPGAGPGAGPAIVPADSFPGMAELDISGSKTIGINIGGPEGSGLNQATRLSVRGEVEGVRVDAELSDQSSPIPAEGTTLELDELDVIRIELEGRNWRGSFGDVDFRLPAAGFGTLERRVVGGLVGGEFGPVGGRLGYARPRGRYGRSAFAGIDGVQGPYVLAPDGREARLVAGSEAVYLDGRRLSRGWDADYTVDYSTGELMFTNRHVISRYSRIEAGYQYVVDAWERSNFIGGVSLLPGGVRVAADYFRESDDPDRGGSYELDAEEREYLAGIGSDTSRAWLDGGTRVPDSAGSYRRENGHYLYVGEGRGNYRVRFSLVGDSLGDYRFDDSLLAHRYVGPGKGDYLAKYRVELPGRTEFGRLEISTGPAGRQFGLTGVGRRSLVNLLAVEPEPGFDGALGAWANWSGDRLGIGYRARLLAPGFEYPGGDSLVDAEYRWGGPTAGRVRHVNELDGRYELRDWLGFGLDLGMLGSDDDSLFARYAGRVRAGPVALDAGRFGRESRAGVEARPEFGRYRPRAGLRRSWSARAARNTWEAGLGLDAGAGLDLDLGYRRLHADTSEDARSSRVLQAGGVAELGAEWQAGDWLRASGRIAHQEASYPASAADNWQSWLTGANFALTPGTGLRVQGDARSSRRLVQLRDEYYRYVGPGEGSYSRDTLTGRYYYDPDGDYERVLAARGSYIPATEVGLNLGGDWTAWRPLNLDATLSRSEVSDSAPVRRSRSHNLRATLRALEPVLTAWLTWTGSSASDRTLAATGRETRRSRYRAELLSTRLPEIELRLRGEYGRDERMGAGDRLEYEERLQAVAAEPVVGSRLRLELELGAERSTITQPVFYPELGEFSLLGLSAGLGRNFNFGTRWRLRGRVGVIRRVASVAELPFDVALTRPLGWTPAAGAELSHVLSDVVTLGARYDFTDRPDRAADHRVSAELRALF